MATLSYYAFLILVGHSLLPYFLTGSFANDNDLIITTKDGKVHGNVLSVLGGEVRAFLGIPYAKPPLGKLRFRAPEPVDKWEGVKDATNYSNACYQLPDAAFPGFWGAEMWNPNTPVSEDCLYLNVWTPRFKDPPSTPLPVMVWIYGGSFTSGTASLYLYDGRYLARSEDVIVVSMNYRVGALGFLSLPDNENIRGNAGLLDQRLAIQWVVDNIAAFGGDPSQVTLFGESAGSVCVGLHVISPGSNRLFQRAVMQSGVPTVSWATLSQAESWKRAKQLGESLGCSSLDPAELEACLLEADAFNITSLQFQVSDAGYTALPFGPIVDGVFLPDTIDVLVKDKNNRKIDLLLGVNHDEATYFLVYGYPGFDLGPSLITRKLFLYNLDRLFSGTELMKQAVIYEYTDWADENNQGKNRDALIALLTDSMFICPLQEFAKSYAESGGKPFIYFFQHRSSINPWPEWTGVMHGYEIEFVFGMPLKASKRYTKEEVEMSKRFMRHWANFARTGNPGDDGDEWPSFTPEHKQYVTLDTSPPEKKTMLRASRCYFWTQFVPQILMSGAQQL